MQGIIILRKASHEFESRPIDREIIYLHHTKSHPILKSLESTFQLSANPLAAEIGETPVAKCAQRTSAQSITQFAAYKESMHRENKNRPHSLRPSVNENPVKLDDTTWAGTEHTALRTKHPKTTDFPLPHTITTVLQFPIRQKLAVAANRSLHSPIPATT